MKKPEADILLIGCVKSKHSNTCQAKDLFNSPLWNYRRKYAERHGCLWYLLSSKHELLCPDTEIQPYDRKLRGLKTAELRKGSKGVLGRLKEKEPELEGKTIEIHAGKEYIEYGFEQGLRGAGTHVRRPLKGLGIGPQLKWYRGNIWIWGPCPKGRQRA